MIKNTGNVGETYQSVAEEARLLEEKVHSAGSHVMLVYKQRIAVSVAQNPAYHDLPPPIFHVSKTTLR